MAGAEYESLPGAFRADLLGLFKNILFKLLDLKRLVRHRARVETAPPEIASVLQIYRQFLRWATGAGRPRQIAQTPHEYLNELSGLLPEAEGDLGLITEQYVRARYGALLLTEDELQQLKQSWYNVKQCRLEDRR